MLHKSVGAKCTTKHDSFDKSSLERRVNGRGRAHIKSITRGGGKRSSRDPGSTPYGSGDGGGDGDDGGESTTSMTRTAATEAKGVRSSSSKGIGEGPRAFSMYKK